MPDTFEGLDDYLATVARLFAADNDLVAVELLSSAKARAEWYRHDNWDGGFDSYNLFLDTPLSLYQRLEERKSSIEERILGRVQAVSGAHTSDHIQSVQIVVEIQPSDGWKDRAQAWLHESAPESTRTEGSSATKPTILCRPIVFRRPARATQEDLVAVMMSFAAEYNETYASIRRAGQKVGLQVKRVDDIWRDSVIVQDVFTLLYQSAVVVVDFSDKNPNVMYETGIAHTLGKQVIPITRSMEDVPFDLWHHRALTYLPNSEGYTELEKALSIRMSTVTGRRAKAE